MSLSNHKAAPESVLNAQSLHTSKSSQATSLSIHNAAYENQFGLLRSLVEEDESRVHATEDSGRTPLHYAIMSKHDTIDIIIYLLSHGADVNSKDISGWTPLHSAVSVGRVSTIKELLGAGADVHAKTSLGMTPLHYAASKGWIDIGKLLIDRGADVNARNNANQTPLHRAATIGSTGFVDLLLSLPEKVGKVRLNTADRAGNTPLHLAMESGHAQVAVRLIEAGADRERRNMEGKIPEEVEGLGDLPQKRVREYVVEMCGALETTGVETPKPTEVPGFDAMYM